MIRVGGECDLNGTKDTAENEGRRVGPEERLGEGRGAEHSAGRGWAAAAHAQDSRGKAGEVLGRIRRVPLQNAQRCHIGVDRPSAVPQREAQGYPPRPVALTAPRWGSLDQSHFPG